MPRSAEYRKRMEQAMRRVQYSIAIIGLGLLGCQHGHNESSKNKYKQLEKENTHQVEVKPIVDQENYISWQAKTGEKFLVKKVWSAEKEQSCKNCHQGYSLQRIKGRVKTRSHWHIRLKHQPGEAMNCQTCHNQGQPWRFNDRKGSISVNETAQLCSSCHFAQKNDWEAGAHGKRASGWQFQKAIYGCTACHNPHNPAFAKRWPKVAPYRPL